MKGSEEKLPHTSFLKADISTSTQLNIDEFRWSIIALSSFFIFDPDIHLDHEEHYPRPCI